MTEAFAPVQREGVTHGVVPLCCIASKWFSRRESIHLRCRLVSRREGPHARITSPHCAPFGRLCGVIEMVSLWDTSSREQNKISHNGLEETTFQ